LNNKLAKLLTKYKAEVYVLEGKDEDEMRIILKIAGIFGTTVGGTVGEKVGGAVGDVVGEKVGNAVGEEGLKFITEEGAKALVEHYGSQTLVDTVVKIAEQGTQVLEPFVGVSVKVIGIIVGSMIGEKIATVATKKYILRTSRSTEQLPQGSTHDLVFEPAY